MTEIELILPELHAAQQTIVDSRARFNVLRCGRRFGKSDLAKDLLIETALDYHLPASYFNATYKLMAQFWDEFKDMVAPITIDKDEQQKTLWFVGGGHVDFWSMQDKNAGRGRKYKRAIVDEAAMADDLETAWTQCIRPTLTDYRGDAFFMSSPKGRLNYFFQLSERCRAQKPNWKEFHFKTTDNPYIDPAEVDDARADLDELTFLQEYMADFVEVGGQKFFYAFKDSAHFFELETTRRYNPALPVYLAFDFNIINSVIVVQKQPDKTGKLCPVVLEEIHQGGSEEEDLEATCKEIAQKYGKNFLHFTGDASGNSGSATSKGNRSAWQEIKRFMFKYGAKFCNYEAVPASNPPLVNSRTICNSLIKHYGPSFGINRKECPVLAGDVVRMKSSSDGGLDKKDCDKYNYGHLGDCLRYYFCNFEYTTFKNLK
ncbi:hypothetical protein GCM10028808_72970 [Spirosoma migulaei]